MIGKKCHDGAFRRRLWRSSGGLKGVGNREDFKYLPRIPSGIGLGQSPAGPGEQARASATLGHLGCFVTSQQVVDIRGGVLVKQRARQC